VHIWFVEIGEPLPFQQGQRLLRYGELTRVLARRGHEVTWWASDFSHQTRDFVGEPNSRVDSDGVTLVLVHGTGYRRNTGLGRLRHVAVHARNLARLIGREQLPDVIVTAMPTIEASLVVANFACKHDIPVIVDIRDEWPEDYVRWLPRPLRGIGRLALSGKFRDLRRVCRIAASLSSVTERQLAYGLKHARRAVGPTDAVFHTGARLAHLPSELVAARVSAWRARGLGSDDFICVFTGTMSHSRPLEATIRAVKKLALRIPLKLVLAGRGDLEGRYRAMSVDCPNIVFAGWVDAVDMAALNEIADVLLAPYSPHYGFSMPTKIFDYLAAGRPLVSSCPGEAEALLARERVGVQIRVDDAAGIESALFGLFENPAERQDMGARARAVFEREFALENILERFGDHIERIAERAKDWVA
jgi:glycosyltransferase involved in cell wall biosynthesis